jgi:uncharacterized protein (DUF1501 family)
MTITRRQFIKSSLAMAPAAALMPTVFTRAVAAAIGEQASQGNRALVIVQMAGGNDGLNTIVPANDDRYYEVRPTVNVQAEDALPINREVGFNPGLAAFKELWDEGVLAAVEGVGYPGPSYSHFQSMDIWQTADPEKSGGFEGWAGRYLEGVPQAQGDGIQSLAVGRSLPRALFTHKMSVPMVNKIEEYQFQDHPGAVADQEQRTRALLGLYRAGGAPAQPFGEHMDSTLRAADSSSKALMGAHGRYRSAVKYPDTRLGRSMKVVAEAVIGGLGLSVAHVKIKGFDTHASQLPVHGDLLRDTADSMLAFYRDMQAQGRDQEVVLMTWSEFGRRVTENGSGGTDHGSAGPMFVLGTPVMGGLYGERPSLTDLVKNNFKYTTDFRQVYATMVEGWLGAPADAVLGGRFKQIPLLRRTPATTPRNHR